MDTLLTPPLAFLLYIPLVLAIIWLGRQLAGFSIEDEVKSQIYASGEEAQDYSAAPGYKPFLLVALFFAILHLGMLVLGLATGNIIPVIFAIGLALALVALILG